MKYVLFLFIKQSNQDLFAKSVAKELSSIVTSESIKYYYGSENIIFTFDSTEEMHYLTEYFELVVGGLKIPYFLTQYIPDKMSFWLEDDAMEHLFNDNTQNIGSKFDDMIERALSEGFSEAENFISKVSEPTKPIRQKYIPSLDELLDKINVSGMGSLTSEEKQLLINYSK
jgi:hypothetical protein